jgi:2-acylglycerol O-acyltransferase 2
VASRLLHPTAPHQPVHVLQIFKTWREYFQFSYLNESTLDPSKNYIFVEFPHGVFPMSELVAGA